MYLRFLVVFVPCALLLLLDLLQLRSPTLSLPVYPGCAWHCRKWLCRGARCLLVAVADSTAPVGRGWVRPGSRLVLARACPISMHSWLGAAWPFSPAPGRSPSRLSDTGQGKQRPVATAACWDCTRGLPSPRQFASVNVLCKYTQGLPSCGNVSFTRRTRTAQTYTRRTHIRRNNLLLPVNAQKNIIHDMHFSMQTTIKRV